MDRTTSTIVQSTVGGVILQPSDDNARLWAGCRFALSICFFVHATAAFVQLADELVAFLG